MKPNLFLFAFLALSLLSKGQSLKDEQAIKEVINSFYNSFKLDNFNNLAEYTTEDINYVHPLGGWLKGRKEVQAVLQEVHNTFLQKTPIKIDTIGIRFITPDVAVVNVIDTMGPYPATDSLNRGNKPAVKSIRTMVIVQKKGKWLLTQNQSTTIQ